MRQGFLACFIFALVIGQCFFVTAEDTINEILLSGVRSQSDQFLFDPNPRESEYLKTHMGGFYVSKYGARYFCLWDILKDERAGPLYVRMELQNPLNKKEPIIQEGVIEPSAKSLNVAYGPIAGLKMYGIYKINVYLYGDEAKMNLLDQLTQEIKSYVDTRKGRMLVDDGLVTKTGEKIADIIK